MSSPRGMDVSGDELERAEASDRGYRDVGRHPNEIDAKANGVSGLAEQSP